MARTSHLRTSRTLAGKHERGYRTRARTEKASQCLAQEANKGTWYVTYLSRAGEGEWLITMLS